MAGQNEDACQLLRQVSVTTHEVVGAEDVRNILTRDELLFSSGLVCLVARKKHRFDS